MATDYKPDDRDSASSLKYVIAFLILSVLIGIAWWCVTMWFVHVYNEGSTPKAQRLADSFSPVNALFTALAFGALIITLWMQHDELQLQRREIRASRIAQEKSEKALSQQAQWLFDAAYIYALSQLKSAYPTVTETTTQFYIPSECKFQGLIEAIVGQLERSGNVAKDASERAAALALCTHIGSYAKAIPKLVERQPVKTWVLVMNSLNTFIDSLPDSYPYPDKLEELHHGDLRVTKRTIKELNTLGDRLGNQGSPQDVPSISRMQQLMFFIRRRLEEWVKQTLHDVEFFESFDQARQHADEPGRSDAESQRADEKQN